MKSLRQTAARVGLEGRFSVLNDFFSFLDGVPPGSSVSFRRHLEGLAGPHVHINLILVGPDDYTDTHLDLIDQAVVDVREVYIQANLGIFVDHFVLEGDDADGFKVITKRSEAKKLMRKYRGPDDRNLDVFFVLVMEFGETKAIGTSAGEHECKSKQRIGQRGAIIGLNFANLAFPDDPPLALSKVGTVFAHEVGHLFGLGHVDDHDLNIMSRPALGFQLTMGQVDEILSNCAVRNP